MADDPTPVDLSADIEIAAPKETPLEPTHAEARPGLYAPHPAATDDVWKDFKHGYNEVLQEMRDVRRACGDAHFRCDPAFQRLMPDLKRLEGLLFMAMHLRPDDADDLLSGYIEIRCGLGHHRHDGRCIIYHVM